MKIPWKDMDVAWNVFATYENLNYSHRALFKFWFEYAEKQILKLREKMWQDKVSAAHW